METQDFLLEASRYLGMGYFDMLEEIWGNNTISPNNDGLLEEATIKFSKMLNVTEDTYTKMLLICRLDAEGAMNTYNRFGMSYGAVSRFYMGDVIEMAETTSIFRLRKDIPAIPGLEEESATNPCALDGIGTSCDVLKSEVVEGYDIDLSDCKCGLPGILLYLYKHTRKEGNMGQTQFRWGKRTNDLYRYKNGYIYANDHSTKERTNIPVISFLSEGADTCIGELNQLAINLLEKTWEKHKWEK